LVVGVFSGMIEAQWSLYEGFEANENKGLKEKKVKRKKSIGRREFMIIVNLFIRKG
jgi:hypothetical protein